MLLELAIAAAAVLAAVCWYSSAPRDYWRRRGVPYVPGSRFFGNTSDLVFSRRSKGEVLRSLYWQLDGHDYGGIFEMRQPALLIRDPGIVKAVMVKDFQHFLDRGVSLNSTSPLAQNLFFMTGQKWRLLRNKLTPTFTSGKMKMMFHAMEECSQLLRKYLAPHAAKSESIDIKEVLGKFSTDVIGTCAFGLQTNALEDPNSEFRKMGKKVFETRLNGFVTRVAFLVFPIFVKLLGLKGIEKDVEDFFMNAVKETVEHRKKNNIQRNDFLQLLIRLKNKERIEDDENHRNRNEVRNESEKELEMDDGLLAAQAFIFFLAGFETSSSAASYALYELALNPEIQKKLRQEVDATLAQCGGRITYDGLMGMKYLDKVVSESMRKFPPVPNLSREVNIPYTLPDRDVKLEKGLKIYIPVYALHHDPKYYPDPDRFDPERFSEEQKSKRPNYTYLPFGEGPRNCIGMRFGLLQTKMGLLALLSEYEFHPCERTMVPLKLDPRAGQTASVKEIVLRVTHRK